METSTTSYAEYDTKNPDNALILSQQNAGNIAYLKQQIDDLFKMKTTVDSLSEQVTALNTQVQGIAQQQADFAQQLGGSSPPDISGTQ
jgi:septal ring factor EnvC (AmiA/AmiB activator)